MRTPIRIPVSSPPPPDEEPVTIYRMLFRNQPPMTVNVSEFHGCDLEGCDCGATVRLGMDAATLINVLVALRAAGITVREIPAPDLTVLPADWKTRPPYSWWPVALLEDSAAKSHAAVTALLDYLRGHGVSFTEVAR